MDADMIGSVLFDIFAPPSKFADFEQFRRRVEQLGARVSAIPLESGVELIRVHNDEKPIPYAALEYAHDWADSKLVSHAYR